MNIILPEMRYKHIKSSIVYLLSLSLIFDLTGINFGNIVFAQSLSTPASSLSTSLSGKTPDSLSSINDTVLTNMRKGKSFRGSKDSQVILIRDLHAQEEAQFRIADAVKQIFREMHVNKVFIEGAHGRVKTLLFKSFPDEGARKKATRNFVRQGYLTGAEAAAIELGVSGGLQLFGVEDTPVYLKNLSAFRITRQSYKEFSPEIEKIDSWISSLKEKKFSDSLKQIDRIRLRLREENPDLKEILTQIEKLLGQNQTLENWQNLKNLQEVYNLGNGIEHEAVEKELTMLVNELQQRLVKDEVKQMVMMTLQYRLGHLEVSQYLDKLRKIYLENFSSETPFDEKYPHLKLWQEMAVKQESLKFDEIWRDVNKLVGNIVKEYSGNEKTESLVALDDRWLNLKKLGKLELSREDWNHLREKSVLDETISLKEDLSGLKKLWPDVPTLPVVSDSLNQLFESARLFYQFAEERDRVIVNQMLKRLSSSDKAVLITGGFHTEGIQNLLEKEGISYSTWTPQLNDAIQSSRYEEIMMNENYHLDKNEFSDKRVAWRQGNTAVRRMLSIPVLRGGILEAIDPADYDRINNDYLEDMLIETMKGKYGSFNDLLVALLQNLGTKLDKLGSQDISLLMKAGAYLFPSEIFLRLPDLDPRNPDQARLAVPLVHALYQERPELAALTERYFKAVREEDELLKSGNGKLDGALELFKQGKTVEGEKELASSARTLINLLKREPGNDVALRLFAEVLEALTIRNVGGENALRVENFEKTGRLISELRKKYPKSRQILELALRNKLNEIRMLFDKAIPQKVLETKADIQNALRLLRDVKKKSSLFIKKHGQELESFPELKIVSTGILQSMDISEVDLYVQEAMLFAGSENPTVINDAKIALEVAMRLAGGLREYPDGADSAINLLHEIVAEDVFNKPDLDETLVSAKRLVEEISRGAVEKSRHELTKIEFSNEALDLLGALNEKEPSKLTLGDVLQTLVTEKFLSPDQSPSKGQPGQEELKSAALRITNLYTLLSWGESNPKEAESIFFEMTRDALGYLREAEVADDESQKALEKDEHLISDVIGAVNGQLNAGELKDARESLTRLSERSSQNPRVANAEHILRSSIEIQELFLKGEKNVQDSHLVLFAKVVINELSGIETFPGLMAIVLSLASHADKLERVYRVLDDGLAEAEEDHLNLAEGKLKELSSLLPSSHSWVIGLSQEIEQSKKRLSEIEVQSLITSARIALELGLRKSDFSELDRSVRLANGAVGIISDKGIEEEKYDVKNLKNLKLWMKKIMDALTAFQNGDYQVSTELYESSREMAQALLKEKGIGENDLDLFNAESLKPRLALAMSEMRSGLHAGKREPIQRAGQLYDALLQRMREEKVEYVEEGDNFYDAELLNRRRDVLSALDQALNDYEERQFDLAIEAFDRAAELGDKLAEEGDFPAQDLQTIHQLASETRALKSLDLAEKFTRTALEEGQMIHLDIAMDQYKKLVQFMLLLNIVSVTAQNGILTREMIENRLRMVTLLHEGHDKANNKMIQAARQVASDAGLSGEDVELIMRSTDMEYLSPDELTEIDVDGEIGILPGLFSLVPEERDPAYLETTANIYDQLRSSEPHEKALNGLSMILQAWLEIARQPQEYAKAQEYLKRALAIIESISTRNDFNISDDARSRFVDTHRSLSQQTQTDIDTLSYLNRARTMFVKAQKTRIIQDYEKSVGFLRWVLNRPNPSEATFHLGQEILASLVDFVSDQLSKRRFTEARSSAQLAKHLVDLMTAQGSMIPENIRQTIVLKYEVVHKFTAFIEVAHEFESDMGAMEARWNQYQRDHNPDSLNEIGVAAIMLLKNTRLNQLPDEIRSSLTERAKAQLFDVVLTLYQLAQAQLQQAETESQEGKFEEVGKLLQSAKKLNDSVFGYLNFNLTPNFKTLPLNEVQRGRIKALQVQHDLIRQKVLEKVFNLAMADEKEAEKRYAASNFKDAEALDDFKEAMMGGIHALSELLRMDENGYRSRAAELTHPFYDIMIHVGMMTTKSEEVEPGQFVRVSIQDFGGLKAALDLLNQMETVLGNALKDPVLVSLSEDERDQHPIYSQIRALINPKYDPAAYELDRNDAEYAPGPVQLELINVKSRSASYTELFDAAQQLADIEDLSRLGQWTDMNLASEALRALERGLMSSEYKHFAYARIVDFLEMVMMLSQNLVHEDKALEAKEYFDFVKNYMDEFESRNRPVITDEEHLAFMHVFTKAEKAVLEIDDAMLDASQFVLKQELLRIRPLQGNVYRKLDLFQTFLLRESDWTKFDHLKKILRLYSAGVLLSNMNDLDPALERYKELLADAGFSGLEAQAVYSDLEWFANEITKTDESFVEVHKMAATLWDLLASKLKELKFDETSELYKNVYALQDYLRYINELKEGLVKIDNTLSNFTGDFNESISFPSAIRRLKEMMPYTSLREEAKQSLLKISEMMLEYGQKIETDRAENYGNLSIGAFSLAQRALYILLPFTSPEDRIHIEHLIAQIEQRILNAQASMDEDNLIPVVIGPMMTAEELDREEQIHVHDYDLILQAFTDFTKDPDTAILSNLYDFPTASLHTVELTGTKDEIGLRLHTLSDRLLNNVLNPMSKMVQEALVKSDWNRVENLLLIEFYLIDALINIYEKSGLIDAPAIEALKQEATKIWMATGKTLLWTLEQSAKNEEAAAAKAVFQRMLDLYRVAYQNLTENEIDSEFHGFRRTMSFVVSPENGLQYLELMDVLAALETTLKRSDLKAAKEQLKAADDLLKSLEKKNADLPDLSALRVQWNEIMAKIEQDIKKQILSQFGLTRDAISRQDLKSAEENIEKARLLSLLADEAFSPEYFERWESAMTTIKEMDYYVSFFKHLEASEFEEILKTRSEKIHSNAVNFIRGMIKISGPMGENSLYAVSINNAFLFLNARAQNFRNESRMDLAESAYHEQLDLTRNLEDSNYRLDDQNQKLHSLHAEIWKNLLSLKLDQAQKALNRGNSLEALKILEPLSEDGEKIILKYDPSEQGAGAGIRDVLWNVISLKNKIETALRDLRNMGMVSRDQLPFVERKEDLFTLADQMLDVMKLLPSLAEKKVIDLLHEIHRRGSLAFQLGKREEASIYFSKLEDARRKLVSIGSPLAAPIQQFLESTGMVQSVASSSDGSVTYLTLAKPENQQNPVNHKTGRSKTGHFALTKKGVVAGQQGLNNESANEQIKIVLDKEDLKQGQTRLSGDVLTFIFNEITEKAALAKSQSEPVDPLIVNWINYVGGREYQALDEATKQNLKNVRIVILKNNTSVAENVDGISYAHFGMEQGPTVFLGGIIVNALLTEYPQGLSTLFKIEMNRKSKREEAGVDERGTDEVIQDLMTRSKLSTGELDPLLNKIFKTEANLSIKKYGIEKLEKFIEQAAPDLKAKSDRAAVVDEIVIGKFKDGKYREVLIQSIIEERRRLEAQTGVAVVRDSAATQKSSNRDDLLNALKSTVMSRADLEAIGLDVLMGEIMLYFGNGKTETLKISQGASQALSQMADRRSGNVEHVVIDLLRNGDLKDSQGLIEKAIHALLEGEPLALGKSLDLDGIHLEHLSVSRKNEMIYISLPSGNLQDAVRQEKSVNAFEFFSRSLNESVVPVFIETPLLSALEKKELDHMIRTYGRRLAVLRGEKIEGLKADDLEILWKNWDRFAALKDANHKVVILSKDGEKTTDMQGASVLRMDQTKTEGLGYVTRFATYIADKGKDAVQSDPVANEMLREVLKVLYAETPELFEGMSFEKIAANPEGFLFPPMKTKGLANDIESFIRTKKTIEAMA